jgi:hypothetical protein
MALTAAEVGDKVRAIVAAGGNDQSLGAQLIDFLKNHDKADPAPAEDEKPAAKSKRAKE